MATSKSRLEPAPPSDPLGWMPEAEQYSFTHKEIAEMMVKRADIHEGKWMLAVQFVFSATGVGQDEDSVLPGAFTGVAQLGIQRVIGDEGISNLTVDAAAINPYPRAKAT